MGFFDRLKKKAKKAVAAAQPDISAVTESDAGTDESAEPACHAAEPAYDGPTFTHDGDTLPQPAGWEGLSVEDWFFKLESLRERIMHADEEDLEPMNDADGDPLDPEEIVLVKEGFQDGGHYEKFRTWGVGKWAAELGEGPTDLEFRLGGVAREKIMASKADAMSGAGGALEPVEDVTCEQWAHINAAIANGGDLKKLVAEAGMDRPKWDRVSAEWTARMQSDTSMAISVVYGNAFSSAGQGQFAAQAGHAASVGVGGDLSDEPVPFERYCEIEAAMSCASDRGEDVNELLKSFGMSAMEWGQIGMFWSKKTQQEAMKYHALYTEYSAKYTAQYTR